MLESINGHAVRSSTTPNRQMPVQLGSAHGVRPLDLRALAALVPEALTLAIRFRATSFGRNIADLEIIEPRQWGDRTPTRAPSLASPAAEWRDANRVNDVYASLMRVRHAKARPAASLPRREIAVVAGHWIDVWCVVLSCSNCAPPVSARAFSGRSCC